MITRRRLPGTFFAVLILSVHAFASSSSAEQSSGHLNWTKWSFDWEVKQNTGLALRNVTYDGERVMAKASMPVIRVKYVKEMRWWNPFSWFRSRATSGRCGPFQDRIQWRDLVPIVNCNGQKVCIESFSGDGVAWLEIGAYARIGAYHIYQAWYLSDDGELRPVMHSRGLSCNTDHDHHPYWRLDFDVAGNGLDQIFVFDEGDVDKGWGPGWTKYTNEQNDLKKPVTRRVWFIRDEPTGRAVWILPGTGYSPLKNDGDPNRFADKDIGVRRNHRAEDEPWLFGARGHLGYDNGESVQEQDVVFWYVAHLRHAAAMGPTQWFSVGPVIRVER
jgi:copper amine oxidase-like protein